MREDDADVGFIDTTRVPSFRLRLKDAHIYYAALEYSPPIKSHFKHRRLQWLPKRAATSNEDESVRAASQMLLSQALPVSHALVR